MIRLIYDQKKDCNIIMPNLEIISKPKYHYLTYRGDSKEEALNFLKNLPSIPSHTYYAVEIGDQAYCRDCLGMYEEKAKFTHIKEKEG